ncbi:MAG: hypothetical protein AB1744_12275, partial [Candidatus Zixiibacteriota bacterium]
MTDGQTLNGFAFSDVMGSSYLPVSGRITGSEVWSAPTPDTSQRRPPMALGLHGDLVVASYGTLLAVFDRNTGQLQWSREIRGNHLFAMNDAGIVTLDHAAYYILLGYDGQPVEEAYLASVNPETFLHFVVGLPDAMLYCVEEFPEPVSDPSEDPAPPVSRCVRYLPRTMHTVWELVLPVNLIGVRAVPDLSRMYVAAANTLFTFSTEQASEKGPVKVELPGAARLSVDHQGNALALCLAKDSSILKCLAPNGTTQWEVSFDGVNVMRQPPASSPDGYIYLMIGSELHQVRDGRRGWSLKLPVDAAQAWLTILSDNSVLMTAGESLFHIS